MIVSPIGPLNAKIAIIGEAPGEKEMRDGEPFVGPAGGVLNDCLHAAGIARGECYITNLFPTEVKKSANKERFSINGEVVYSTRSGFTEAGNIYKEALLKELETLTANVLVPLGGPALDAVTGERGITKYRGSILKGVLGRKTVPAIHPSATFQNHLYRYDIIFDLKRAKRQSEFPEIRRVERDYIFKPDLTTVANFCNTWDKPLTLDIEIFRQEIQCIGLGDQHQVLVIPFIYEQGSYWSEADEVEVWRSIATLLENPTIPKIGQNLMFDLWTIMHTNKVITRGELHDTMVAQNLLYPDFPAGLDFIASVHTEEPYWKDDGKQWYKEPDSYDVRWLYNARDVSSTDTAYYKLMSIMTPEYRKAYDDRMKVFEALLYMQIRGTKCDLDSLHEVREEVAEQIIIKQAELDEIVGYPLNIDSPKQMFAYFYGELGIKPFKNRKTGRDTCDDNALRRIARGTKTRPPYKEAKIVQDIRSYSKLKGTYLDIRFDEDARLRCAYNPCGAITGRLSSSQTLFGTGTNMQNLPQSFRRFLVPDEGCIFAEIDKKQAEWVVVAYLAQDARMMEVHENGEDAHLKTAHYSFDVSEETILKERELVGHATDAEEIAAARAQLPELEGKILPQSMTLRQAGKKANHGQNYGLGYRGFAEDNDIPESDSKLICEGYHKSYPGIQNTYYRWVKTCLNQQGKHNLTLHNLYGRPRRFLDRFNYKLLLNAYAYPPQSTIGQLVINGMIEIYSDEEEYMKWLDMLANIHDSILTQYRVDTDEDILNWAKALDRSRHHLNPTLSFQGRSFQIGTDLAIGLNWGETGLDNPLGMREIPFSHDVEELAQELKNEVEILRS